MSPKRDEMNATLKEFYEKWGNDILHCDGCNILLPHRCGLEFLPILTGQTDVFKAFHDIVVSQLGEQHFKRGEDVKEGDPPITKLFKILGEVMVMELEGCGHHVCIACKAEGDAVQGCVVCQDAPKI